MSKRKKRSQVKDHKELIINTLLHYPSQLFTFLELKEITNTSDEDDIFFKLMLEELVDEQKIVVFESKFQIFKHEDATIKIGKVDFVNPKFAFIRYDDLLSDIYIPVEDLNGALDSDVVKVKMFDKKRNAKNPEGVVLEILKRGRTEVVGKLKVFPNYALLRPDNKGFFEDIFIPKESISTAVTSDLVIARITRYPTPSLQAAAEVIQVLGPVGNNDAEMNAIMAEFGLPVAFPEEAIRESEAISELISDEEISRRKDFRNILTFTIDPHDAKDFDDAISYHELGNGNIEIGVHIADVSHYLQPGTALEEEALKRATSVYLVDRTIPMLPEKLSNNLCSLRPKEDKLVFSAVFEMDMNSTDVHNEWYGKGIIHSDRRFTYEEAQETLEGSNTEHEPMYEKVLSLLNQIAKKLRQERFKKGAFNFEAPEVKFRLDETGKPVGIYTKVRKDAHKLVEEYMLLTNRKVSEYVSRLKTVGEDPTMIYRVHEPPNPTKLDTFAKFANRLGFTIKTETNAQLSKSLNKLVIDIEGTPIQQVLESLAVRTMSKARYTLQNLGHFGLAFDHYSHFTSPIRRYPDVMAHRMLEHYLKGGTSLPKDGLEEKAKHSSEREKMAAEAERASIKYKQVEYISYQPRDIEFDGVVTGVTDFGIFVEIEGTASEGLIKLADLADDYYEFDADNYRVVGKRKKKIIGFGNKVKVKIAQTDLEKRTIDLKLISVEDQPMSIKSITTKTRGGVRSKKDHNRKKRR